MTERIPPQPEQEKGCTCTWAYRKPYWIRSQERGQQCPVHSMWGKNKKDEQDEQGKKRKKRKK